MRFQKKFIAKGRECLFDYEIINQTLICSVYLEDKKICIFSADSLKKAMQKLKSKIFFLNEKIDIKFI